MSTQTAGVVPQWTRGDRLRKARLMTGLTMREFADRLGVSTATVNSAEHDQRAVRKITIKAWAMASGVDPQWLAEGDATPPGESSSWALRDSNPQPTDYGYAQVIGLCARRLAVAPRGEAA